MVKLLLLRAVCSCGAVRFQNSVLAVVLLITAVPAAAFDEAFKVIANTGLWNPDRPIVYVLDPAGSDDVADDSELQALRDAFRAWSCVPEVNLPLQEGTVVGPRVLDLGDDKNTLFWDETGEECGMSGGTLGITVGPVSGGTKTNTDICFNGADHEWGVGSATDVQSIALHEIGHFLGLDHPCDDDQDPASCLSPEAALMFPSWSGGLDREPLSSDIAGVQSLYPLGNAPTSCTAPFFQNERCGCNDECADGLFCVADSTGDLRCSAPCSTSDRECGRGAACVVDNADGSGLCVRVEPGESPPGAICRLSGECANDNCGAIIKLGSSVCLFQCDTDADCSGGTCFDGFCLAASASQECPATDSGCGCSTTNPVTPSTVALSLLVLWTLRRRRRS